MIVKTNYGEIKGIKENGCVVYKGIPYAKPPVGELRWKAPRPPEGWQGVLNADKFPNRCVQGIAKPDEFYGKEFYSNPDFVPEMSEDCLYLNIWAPENSEGKKLPVAFWIHGGAFLHGFGSELEFDGAEYCKRGVILVTINYRVNAFGFLAHDWLADENGRSGNYAILDQVAALKWVYENIEAFGGDKENITAFGQSAGAMSVQTLVSSELTKGMISAAIFQSAGGYGSPINRDCTLTEAMEMGNEFVRLTGAKSADELRAIPAEELFAAVRKFLSAEKPLPFRPVIDDYVLKQGYDETVDKKLHHDVPYMLGSTLNDIGSDNGTGEMNPLYQACINWSLKNEAIGRKSAYVYYFKRKPLGDDAGAFHSCELWYMFGTLSRSWRPKDENDYALSRQMLDYWTNFMKHHDPNGKELPMWQPCTAKDKFVAELD